MHQHVAALVRFQPEQLFSLQCAQDIRKTPQTNLPLGEVRIFRLHGGFEDGRIHAVKTVLLVFRKDARKDMRKVVPRDLFARRRVRLAERDDEVVTLALHRERAKLLGKARQQLAKRRKPDALFGKVWEEIEYEFKRYKDRRKLTDSIRRRIHGKK